VVYHADYDKIELQKINYDVISVRHRKTSKTSSPFTENIITEKHRKLQQKQHRKHHRQSPLRHQKTSSK